MTTKSIDTTKSLNDGLLGGVALGLVGGMFLGAMLALMALAAVVGPTF
jgi:hypothetical protein